MGAQPRLCLTDTIRTLRTRWLPGFRTFGRCRGAAFAQPAVALGHQAAIQPKPTCLPAGAVRMCQHDAAGSPMPIVLSNVGIETPAARAPHESQLAQSEAFVLFDQSGSRFQFERTTTHRSDAETIQSTTHNSGLGARWPQARRRDVSHAALTNALHAAQVDSIFTVLVISYRH